MSLAPCNIVDSIVGPRIPEAELRRHRPRYVLPNILFTFARIALLVSLFVPYWRMTLKAPQYPQGLHVHAYVNHLEGDVPEIDELNHYIGMKPLNEAAKFERQTAIAAIIALVLLIEAAIYIHNKYAAILALPAILFPPLFLIDLHYWMAKFGQNLDPHAPLNHAIKPFVPPVLGTGKIGQFYTVASAGEGLYLACAAAVLLLIGLYFHRRAYKPLMVK